jgi:hypothetical protein
MVNAAHRGERVKVIPARKTWAWEGDLVNAQRLQERPYEAERWPPAGIGRLRVGAAWLLILLLSLGLWAAIWLAISSLLSY